MNLINKLKAIFINVNSIVSRLKIHYLHLFAEKLAPRHNIQIKNYNDFHQNRVGGGGCGTVIMVRSWIKTEQIPMNLGSNKCNRRKLLHVTFREVKNVVVATF